MQNSLQVVENALVDKTVCGAIPLTTFQFERVGYFCVDLDSTADKVCLHIVLTACLNVIAHCKRSPSNYYGYNYMYIAFCYHMVIYLILSRWK